METRRCYRCGLISCEGLYGGVCSDLPKEVVKPQTTVSARASDAVEDTVLMLVDFMGSNGIEVADSTDAHSFVVKYGDGTSVIVSVKEVKNGQESK